MLEAVGLADRMHRKIRTLSGGMRQRVALAAALVGDPELLLLDEPATGLDPEQRLELRSLLAGAARRGTVLLSTHNTAEVAALCQRVAVMREGRIRFLGTPRELVAIADGRVWESDHDEAGAARSWMTAEGHYRHVGEPPAGRPGGAADARRRLPAGRRARTAYAVTAPGVVLQRRRADREGRRPGLR